MKKSIALSLACSVLWSCVTKLPVLPPAPRESLDRMRGAIEEMAHSVPEELPPPVAGRPAADLSCSQAAEDPTLWLCVGDPERMGDGAGLFFSYQGGAAADLAKILASERLLRDLVHASRERITVRDRTLLAQLVVLDTLLAMAEDYRMIAIVRGEEIERLQRDRIIDRFTMTIPVFGLGAGIVYMLVR